MTENKNEYKVIKIFIASGDKTKKLYRLESERNNKIKECAEEWQRLVKQDLNEDYPFYQVAIPTAFYDMLDGYDTKSGICACKFFLEKEGYKIIKK